MPKIFGTNILVILLAGFLFFMLGAIWYGALFGEQWMALTGVTEATAEETMGRSLAVGCLLSLLQAVGLAGILQMKSATGIGSSLKASALTWLFFALPITAYAWNYEGRSPNLLHIDAGYLLVGYLLMGIVYGVLRKN